MIDAYSKSELENFENLFDEFDVGSITAHANDEHIKQYLSNSSKLEIPIELANKISILIERVASDALILEKSDENIDRIAKWFNIAFVCRRSKIFNSDDVNLQELFLFSTSGILSNNLAQIRVLLREFDVKDDFCNGKPWNDQLREKIIIAMIFLIKKDNGWKDIEEALRIINDLRKDQEKYESEILSIKFEKVVPELIVYYNLAKIVDLTAQYTLKGSPSNILTKIKRFYDNACMAEKFGVPDDLHLIIDMTYIACFQLIKNTIWYNTRSLVTNEKIQEYVDVLTHEEFSPIIDLLPSQQKALAQDPLSIVKRSIVISMPTSAGKTLMAEFSIVQAYSGSPTAKIIYLVPTRALVNQITLNLRRKLGKIGIIVESAVPVFELDTIEDKLLKKDFNVLVSTPEKLDLLIREKHQCVENISLIIVDEAHNIQIKGRGAKLELLLTSINQERERIRFLLLSPFVPNSPQIAQWLGGSQSKEIHVYWRPSEALVALSKVRSHSNMEYLSLQIIPSFINPLIKEPIGIQFYQNIPEGNRNTHTKSSLASVLNLQSDNGCVLILCRSPRKATERATELMDYLPNIELDDFSQLIVDYIKEELGENHILPRMLKKGIAIHHSGLSLESRYLIERLVESKKIKILAATTTLAQGVNFPIKHVVIESISVPSRPARDMTYSEFWNIAGRAGRAFNDHMGLIVYAISSKKDEIAFKRYNRETSDAILSSILLTLDAIEVSRIKFDLNFVRTNPDLGNFVQYLFHMVKVSSYKEISSHLDETLRSSLVYYQLEQSGRGGAKLIQLAKKYLESLNVTLKENAGIQQMVDSTGFTSMSVGAIIATSKEKIILNPFAWDENEIFSKSTPQLKNIIDVVKEIPEIDLSRFSGGPLDVEEIAELTKDWVNGASITKISDTYFSREPDPSIRIFQASNYVNSQLMQQISWGTTALQKLSAFYNKEIDFEKISHFPALIYFGVRSKDALTMRMMGVPRFVAEDLGTVYSKEFSKKDPSFTDIRNWLLKLDDETWAKSSRLKYIRGPRVKQLWKLLNGIE